MLARVDQRISSLSGVTRPEKGQVRNPVPRGAWALSAAKRWSAHPGGLCPQGPFPRNSLKPLSLCVLLRGLSESGMREGTSPLASRAPTQRGPGSLLVVVLCPPMTRGLVTAGELRWTL